MNLFSNLKVGTKLATAFGALLALLALIAVVAGLRIQAINDHVAEILDDRFRKVTLATDLDQATNVQARFLRNAIIGSKDPEEVRTSLERVEKAAAENNATLAELDKMINTPKGRELFKALTDARARYAAGRNEVVRMVKEGKVEEAGTHLLKTVRPAQNQYLDAIDAMSQFQAGLMAKSGAEAKADGAAAIRTTVVAGLIAAALGIAMAIGITRALVGQIGGEPGDVVKVANAIAAGDLNVPVPVRAGDTTSIVAAMGAMRAKLVDIVGQVRQSSDSIATGSAQIATGNADLSQRTEEQASNLQQTAASMEQLTGTVKANADTAQQASRLAGDAAAAANQGGEAVGRVVSTMQEISASSRKIVDIIGTIDGIAFQTNILALNAAVEAARAGEQGRGFAVVASEVRTLAQRSAEAAKEIKALIGASVDKVEAGSKQVDEAGASMNEIVAQVGRVSQLIAEISNATVQQTSGIGQVGDAVSQLDQVTQQNAALVEESAAAAESLKQQATRLTEVVGYFRVAHTASRAAAPAVAPRSAPAPKASTPKTWATKAPAAAKPAPAAQPPAAAATAGGASDDWETF